MGKFYAAVKDAAYAAIEAHRAAEIALVEEIEQDIAQHGLIKLDVDPATGGIAGALQRLIESETPSGV